MMKKVLWLLVAVVLVSAAVQSVMAAVPVEGLEHCYFNYACAKSVNPVTADGVYHEDEWSDAVELVMNKDTMQDFGRWQSAGEPNPADEFSCTYRFKWDETYFYVLEIRTDAHYVSNFNGNDYNAQSPWMLDGTAIFFCDNELPEESNRCDIKFYSFVDELKGPAVYIGQGNEPEDAYTGPSGEADTTYGGTVDGNTIVFELKMAWNVMKDQWHLDSEIKEGTVFRFTPIIMNRDTVDDYAQWDGSSYRQMNFHDCMELPDEDAVNSENPEYWAALTLSAAGAGASSPAAGAAPEGLIYAQDFNSVSSFSDLGWTLAEDLSTNTAEYTIENGRLIVDNLDATRGATTDSYVKILPSEAMEPYQEGDYTILYTLTYLDAEASSRYLAMIYNYDGTDTYNSVHIRVQGKGHNDCRYYGSWYSNDEGSDHILNATDENSLATVLCGAEYDEEAMPLLNVEMNVAIKCSHEAGPSVYINGILFSTTSDLTYWGDFEQYAVGLKASPKIKAAVDNIVIYKGLGDAPAIPEGYVYTPVQAEVKTQEPQPEAPAGYPASGESGNFMMGKIIGNETGWDGTAGSGAASAFDGKAETFFDPLGVGDGFCGMEYDEPYILEKVAILSRSTFLDRFAGASIEGSNDGEEWETLWESDDVAPSAEEYNIVTEFENNYGYKMFRYINWINHGDVAEVEFYGKPGKVDPPPKEEEPAPEPEPEPETPTVEEVVENAAENVTEAVENVAEAAGDAVENAAEAVTGAVENAKSGCGSFIGGGFIVIVTVLGTALVSTRIAKRR